MNKRWDTRLNESPLESAAALENERMASGGRRSPPAPSAGGPAHLTTYDRSWTKKRLTISAHSDNHSSTTYSVVLTGTETIFRATDDRVRGSGRGSRLRNAVQGDNGSLFSLIDKKKNRERSAYLPSDR